MNIKVFVIVDLQSPEIFLKGYEHLHESVQARLAVWTTLSVDPHFLPVGRFSMGVCKRFTIGGSYSGSLYPQSTLNQFYNEADKLRRAHEANKSEYLDFAHQNRKELDAIWRQLGGKNSSPLTRGKLHGLGASDDACLMSEWLVEELTTLVSQKNGQDTWGAWMDEETRHPLIIPIAENGQCTEPEIWREDIGKSWVVILDCEIAE